MISSKVQSLHRSDWSVSPTNTAHDHQWSIANHTDDDQSKRMDKKQCKLFKCCSSIPPLIRGFLLGILPGCLILAIILPIWLIKKPTSQKVVTPMLRWNTTAITIAGISSNAGNSNNQFNTSVDVILDWKNDLYIADNRNSRIQKYIFNTFVGTTAGGNGIRGTSASQLNNPTRVLLDVKANLYISDTSNHRIQFWNNGAANGTTIAGVTGSPGSASDQLNTPYGIALHPILGELYIAEYSNHRIVSYPFGINNGTLLLGGRGLGCNNTQLRNPVGLYYDSYSNSLVIANFGCHNIVRYLFGATNWTLVAGSSSGTAGWDSASFSSPVDMTFDPMGNMYVVDRNNQRIQFFSPGERSGRTIVGITGVTGANATTFDNPWAVRLDSQLNLYVADANNYRIQKFLRY